MIILDGVKLDKQKGFAYFKELDNIPDHEIGFGTLYFKDGEFFAKDGSGNIISLSKKTNLSVDTDLFIVNGTQRRVQLNTSQESSVDVGFNAMKSKFIINGGDISPLGLENYGNTATIGATIIARRSRGTFASKIVVTTDDVLGGIFARGYDGTEADWDASGGFNSAFRMLSGSTFTNSNHHSYMDWAITPSGQTTRTIHMILDSVNGLSLGATTGSKTYKINALELVSSNINTSNIVTTSIGGNLIVGGTYNLATIIDIGNSSNSGTVAGLDFHFGVGSSEDYNVRLFNNADKSMQFLNSTGGIPISFTSSLVSIGTGFNFAVKSNVLFVDTTNNRVGINNSSPSHSFDIVGNERIVSSAAGGFGLHVQTDSLTTGYNSRFYSNSSDTNTRNLVEIINDNSSATGTRPLFIKNDARINTNFQIIANWDGSKIYRSVNGTTPISNLTTGITQGDICINGVNGSMYIYNGTIWKELAQV